MVARLPISVDLRQPLMKISSVRSTDSCPRTGTHRRRGPDYDDGPSRESCQPTYRRSIASQDRCRWSIPFRAQRVS